VTRLRKVISVQDHCDPLLWGVWPLQPLYARKELVDAEGNNPTGVHWIGRYVFVRKTMLQPGGWLGVVWKLVR
jgi:hypothetical protein